MSEQPQPQPPFSRVKAYLKELKSVLRLLREVLVELKDTLAIITVIVFFILGVYEALSLLISQPPRAERQSVSKPYNPDHR